jgi:hypothetical protein
MEACGIRPAMANLPECWNKDTQDWKLRNAVFLNSEKIILTKTGEMIATT